MANRPYRTVLVSHVLSALGDYMALPAAMVLVYDQTNSPGLAAATLAITLLPAAAGPILATIGDRYPARPLMITCDIARAVAIGAVAIGGIPIPVILILLFATALLNPPFQATRSALLLSILDRDRYPVGLSLLLSTTQAAQVAGFVFGAAIAVANPRAAIIADALTFLASAALLRRGLPATAKRERESTLLRETLAGFSAVFGQPIPRSIAIVVFTLAVFAVVPQGLAIAWAAESTSSDGQRGLALALIMIGGPVGQIVGAIVVAHLAADLRQRLVRPLALLVPLSLLPALADPPPPLVSLMTAVSGFAIGGLVPSANAQSMLVIPRELRARASGVMRAGLQLAQAGAVATAGWLANHFELVGVVGWAGITGTLAVAVALRWWPADRRLEEEIVAAETAAGPGRTEVSSDQPSG